MGCKNTTSFSVVPVALFAKNRKVPTDLNHHFSNQTVDDAAQ